MPVKQPADGLEKLILFLSVGKFHWSALVPALIAGFLFALSMTLMPLTIDQIIDQMMPDGNQHVLKYLLVLFSTLLLAVIFTNSVTIYVYERLLSRIALSLRVEMSRKLLALPPAFYNFTIEIIFLYFFESIGKLCHNIMLLGLNFSRDFLVVVGLLGVMVWLSLETSLFVIVILIAFFLIRQIVYLDLDQQNKSDQRQYEISENIAKVLRLRRSTNLDNSYAQQIRHIQNTFDQFQLSLHVQSRQKKMLELFSCSLLIGILTISLYYLLQQHALSRLTIGDTVAFITAGVMLVFPLQKLVNSNFLLKQCNEALQIIFSLLDQASGDVENDCHVICLDRCKGKLKFEEISSQDEQSRLLLPCFNLEIASGQKIVLVNQDPNINRLFADLVCGFVQPSTGKILLDSNDTRQMVLPELHKHIAWISPDQDLLSDTIAANIACGSFSCSKEIAITAAAHASLAMEFIQKLPQGLQTKNDSTSQIFSNDQRQRILIARALLKNPSVIILDETAAYFETDNAALLQALQVLLNNRTSLILSSRSVMRNLADWQFDPGNPESLRAA